MKRPSLAAFALAVLLLLGLAALLGAQPTGDPLLLLLEREAPAKAKLLPAEAVVVPEFRPGPGEGIGLVDFVENDAYIIHQGEPATAFKAAKTLPIVAGDTLVVEADSRLVVLLNDQSQFTLAASSWLRLDKSVYDPQKGFRDTVASLAAGKARFVVKKMEQAGGENFRVDTPVASCGVRGSDFVVALVPRSALPAEQGFLDGFGPRTAQAAFWQPSGQGAATPLAGDPAAFGRSERQAGFPPSPQPPVPLGEIVATNDATTVSVANSTGSQVVASNQIIPIYGPFVPMSPPLPLSPGAFGHSVGRFSAQPANMRMPAVFE